MAPMTKPRDDSPFPTSLDQPDVNVSINRVAVWLDSSPDTVRRISDGPEWFHISTNLIRSSAHDWIRWLQRKQEEQRAARLLAAAAPAEPAPPKGPRGRPPKAESVPIPAPPALGKRPRGRPRKYPPQPQQVTG
jgi:hypothetical protein